MKKSAAKRNRQAIGRRMRNRTAKSSLKTAIKKFTSAVEKKDKAAAETEYKNVQSLLDNVSSRGILHLSTTSRKKSRLNKQLQAIQ